MNFRVLSLIAGSLSFVAAVFWLFCLVSGSNADGIREAAFIEIQRDYSSIAMMSPAMGFGGMGMGGMGMGMGMGGMGMGMGGMGMGMGMMPSYKLTLALRAWCVYQYKVGMGMPTPLWGDFGTLPSYDIKQLDDTVIQCVHPWVALNDQRIVMTMAQVIGLQNPMMAMGLGIDSGFLMDRATTLYSGLEADYYILLIMSLITAGVAFAGITMRRRALPLASAVCACLILIPAIIAFSIWTYIYSRFLTYVQFSNMWQNDIWVRLGTSYWLTVVATIISMVVTVAALLSLWETQKEIKQKEKTIVVA